jgi:DnaB-helicase binding domain of primase
MDGGFKGFGMSEGQMSDLARLAALAERSPQGRQRFASEITDKINSLPPESLAREQLTAFAKRFGWSDFTPQP